MLPLVFRNHFFWEDHPGYFPEVIRMLVESALARNDVETAEMFVRDYQAKERMPMTQVSKFVPGSHFYVFDTKFDTLEEAQRHAKSRGYRVAANVLELNVDNLASVRAGRRTREGD